MHRVYVLTCLVIVYTCYGMNPYTFDVSAVEHRIDRADSVHDFLTIAIEQLGVARFIAERTTFDRDSYMSAYYDSDTFDYRHMLELFCKEEFFKQHKAHDFFRLLKDLGILNEKSYAQVCVQFGFDQKKLETEPIAPYVKIDARTKWLQQLSDCRQKLHNALCFDPYTGQQTLIEGIYLLAHFTSDLGSLLHIEPDKLNQPDMLKTCLQSNNHILFDTLTILCCAKKTEKTSEEPPELAEPAFLDDYHYMRYYGHENDRYPRKAIIEHYGIYDVVSLVPMPRQTSYLVKKEKKE